MLNVVQIEINKDNPRTVDEKSESFRELVDSVRASGVLVPVHIRRVTEGANGRFQLLAGERRVRATIAAGRDTLPVIDHGVITDKEAFEIMFVENFGREDMTVMEQGKAVEVLLAKYNGDVKAVASKLGKSVSWVMQRNRINSRLSKKWKEKISEYPLAHMTAAHVQIVAALPLEVQDRFLEECEEMFESAFWNDDGKIPSVSAIEEMIAEQMRMMSLAKWDLADRTLDKKACSCKTCKKRTAAQPGLFDDTTDMEKVRVNDRCLDEKCWGRKKAAYLQQASKALKQEHPNMLHIVGPHGPADYHIKYVLAAEFGDCTANYSKSKEGATGAVPALIVAGDGTGETLWVKPKIEGSSSSTARSSSKKAGSGKALNPKSIKEKEAELESKRWCAVLEKLKDVVRKSKVDQLRYEGELLEKWQMPGFVIAVAATFGTKSCWEWLYDKRAGWKDFEKKMSTPDLQQEARQDLWTDVCLVLASRLNYSLPVTQLMKNNKEYIQEAKSIAGFLGIDLEGMFAEQVKAIPEPKAWAKQRAEEAAEADKRKDKKTPAKKKAVKKKPATSSKADSTKTEDDKDAA